MFTCFLGECIGRFTNRKIPYCVKFNPDEVLSFHVFFFNFLTQELKNLRKEVLVFIVTFFLSLSSSCIFVHYYMPLSHKDWELPNS